MEGRERGWVGMKERKYFKKTNIFLDFVCILGQFHDVNEDKSSITLLCAQDHSYMFTVELLKM